MKVAGFQMDIAWESPKANLVRVAERLGEAAAEGYDLLVLPEMFATGFLMNAKRAAQASNETQRALSELCQRHNIAVVYGSAELVPGDESGRAVNVSVAINKAGVVVSRYEKIHPFSYAKEHKHFVGGRCLRPFVLDGVRITPFICYDLRFSDVFLRAAKNTDLILVIANWPSARSVAWRTLLRARAIECQAYVLGVNRVGEGSGLHYSGDSMFIDPLGELLDEAVEKEALIGAEVHAAHVAKIRRQYPFLSDRRPEIYRNL